tara:strand:- start:7 stop:231 length:225 start_codon:yes stop_codon:yes gene_type:complete
MTYINYWLKEMVKNTPNDADLGSKIREMSWKQDEIQKEYDNVSARDKKYIYESPDGGKTIYRREFGNYDKREKL